MRMVTTRRMGSAVLAAVAVTFTLLVGIRPGSATPGAINRSAPAGQIDCQGKATQISAAANPGIHGTAVAYNSDPNHWDPTPLLSVTVHVGGRVDSCLVAHLSAMAQPQDNWVVFQVRIDGAPMQGHAAGLAGLVEPAVFDPDESTSIGPYRMVAHDFFATVKPGDHVVDVVWAGCCSGNPLGSGAAVENPVITIQHQ